MDMQPNSAQIIEQLNDRILTLEQQNAELNARIKWFEEQLRLSRQRQFGTSSDKTSPEQINLFNEAEDTTDTSVEEPTIETITYERQKKQPGQRAEMLKDLPVEVIEYRLPEDEQVCPCCQGKLHEMSTQIRQVLLPIQADRKLMELPDRELPDIMTIA